MKHILHIHVQIPVRHMLEHKGRAFKNMHGIFFPLKKSLRMFT